MKRILLACPVSDFKRYIIFDWLLMVKANYSSICNVLLVDNSFNEDFHREIKNFAPWVSVIRRKPYKNEKLNQTMAACNNIINRELQKGGYEALFSLECDVFPVQNFILDQPYLLNKQHWPILSGIYNIQHFPNRKLMVQTLEETHNFDYRVRVLTQSEGFLFVDGTIKQVFSAGMGCVLIRSEVLKDYEFKVDPALKVHADTFFARDMYQKQIPFMVNTAMYAKHFNSDWTQINKRYERKQSINA